MSLPTSRRGTDDPYILRQATHYPLCSVKTAKWIGDCFIYTTGNKRLSYFIGNESYTISPFDT